MKIPKGSTVYRATDERVAELKAQGRELLELPFRKCGENQFSFAGFVARDPIYRDSYYGELASMLIAVPNKYGDKPKFDFEILPMLAKGKSAKVIRESAIKEDDFVKGTAFLANIQDKRFGEYRVNIYITDIKVFKNTEEEK